MEDDILVLNPKRRRRRMTAKQRRYFGGGRRTRRRRNPPTVFAANPRRRRRRARSVFVHSRRGYHRINPAGNIIGSITEVVKAGVVGVVGITANNAVGNTAAKLLQVAPGMNTQLVKAGTAVLLPTIVGMLAPQFKRMAVEAGAVALAHEASKFLDKNVWPQLGEVGRILSSGDAAAAGSGAQTPPASTNGVGYLPGARYVSGNGQPYTDRAPYIGYLPGGAPYLGRGYASPYEASATC